MKRSVRVVLIVVIIGLILAAGAGFVFIQPLPATSEALQALETGSASDGRTVEIEVGEWYTFSPPDTPPSGFVFYPGGLVDPQAYAPFAVDLAARGHLVVIVPMPINLAVIAPDSANAVLEAYPEITTWAIGGHSLGGAMAARYAANNPNQVRGLVLWAAYPEDSLTFGDETLRVVSIYGTNDGVADADRILAAERILPANTRFVAIAGGNHAQFGYYGAQRGDNEATISPLEQRDQVVEATALLLADLLN